MANRDDQNERDGFDVNRRGRGNRAAERLEKEHLESTGHPSGGAGGGRGDLLQGDLPPNVDPQRVQEPQKRQAQSPRERTHDEPEKKRVPGGRG